MKWSHVQAGKSELTESLGVHSRDLRVLDAQRSNSSYPSCILCREKALVINLEFIQVCLSCRNLSKMLRCRNAARVWVCCGPDLPPLVMSHPAVLSHASGDQN